MFLQSSSTTGVLDPAASIEFSRGCPWDCAFCSAWTFYGRSYRKVDPEICAEELRSIREPGVFIVDDVAFVHGDLLFDVEQPARKQRRHLTRQDVNVGTVGNETLHEVRADEPGAAGYEDVCVPERVHGPFPSTTSEVSSRASL